MNDPYVPPAEATAEEAIAAIRDEFDFLEDGEMQLMQLMDYAKRSPRFPEEWKDEARLVPGCLAKVWLDTSQRDGKLLLAGTSNAMLVAGVVALLMRVYSGRTPDEILATDPGFIATLGMPELTSNRKNGIAAMLTRIRQAAQAELTRS